MISVILNRNAALRVIAAITLALIAQQYASAQKSWRYGNVQFHFTIEIPYGWTKARNMPSTVVAFTGQKVQGFAPNFNVTSTVVGNTSLADYAASIRKRYAKIEAAQKTKTQNNRVVPITHINVYGEKAVKLGGLPAYGWHVQISTPNRPPIEERQVFCIQDKHSYGLTFATRKQDAKQYDPMFDKMVASFHWDQHLH